MCSNTIGSMREKEDECSGVSGRPQAALSRFDGFSVKGHAYMGCAHRAASHSEAGADVPRTGSQT